MKLYRVVVDRILYVLADDAKQAEERALNAEPNPDETDAKAELAHASQVEADHWVNCPVYHGRGELAGVAVHRNYT